MMNAGAAASSVATSQRFACDPVAIEASRVMVCELLAPLGIDEAALSRIEVVLEEIVSNVVRHSAEARVLDLSVQWQSGLLSLVLSDDGEAFDPLAAPEPEPFTELSEARLGGLGIALVRKFSVSMSYERNKTAPRPTNNLRIVMPAPLSS